MHRAWLIPLLALLVVPLAGCKGSCRQLSERLCDCSATPNEKTICLTNVGNNDGRYAPDEADNARCAAYLKTCDCHLVDTPEGKKACGLAR